MKTGDTVRVHDVSQSLYRDGAADEPAWKSEWENVTSDSRWQVVARNCSLPTDRSLTLDADANDMMLCEVDHPERLLSTKEKFCTVISPEAPPENMTVDIPEGTEHVTIHRSLGVRFTFEDCKTKD